MISLSVYHFFEYCFCLLFHFEKVHPDSFLINQGKHYTFAMAFAFLEYFIEFAFVPWLKLNPAAWVITVIGVGVTVVGHYFRIGAEFTAKNNFTHKIRYTKKEEHKLITHGVYSFSRHPGYFGWFLWSVGTQLMICNPISAIGFFFASYYFFKDRIVIEEELLVHFFGYDYIAYRNSVPTRIPFIQ